MSDNHKPAAPDPERDARREAFMDSFLGRPHPSGEVDEATRAKLLLGFMLDCNVIGAKEAGVNLARGIKDTLTASQAGETR